jgi:hypothetical protein
MVALLTLEPAVPLSVHVARRKLVNPNTLQYANVPDSALFTTNASGELFSEGEQISANTGDTEVLVATSAAIGDITTYFSGNGGFSWTNKAFFGGAASFCSKGAYLWAEFTETIPEGCNALVLSAVPASACDTSTTSSSLSTTFSTVSSSTFSFSNTSTIATATA